MDALYAWKQSLSLDLLSDEGLHVMRDHATSLHQKALARSASSPFAARLEPLIAALHSEILLREERVILAAMLQLALSEAGSNDSPLSCMIRELAGDLK